MEDPNILMQDTALRLDTFVDKKILKTKLTYNKKYFYNITKRVVDIVSSIIGIILLVPITLLVFLCNIINKEKGQVFFIQERIGKDGKNFKMYKFRTMVQNADAMLESMLENDEKMKEEYNTYKKLKDDIRITKVGRFLRKTSLDEFPQFINVLKGDMTLVGPRPYLPREVGDMGTYYEQIIKEKPGLTGFWQVAGRNNLTFNDRLEMDIDYGKEKSMKLDLKLVVQTIVKVLRHDGAL